MSSVGTLRLSLPEADGDAPKSPRYGYEVVNARDDLAAGLQPPARLAPGGVARRPGAHRPTRRRSRSWRRAPRRSPTARARELVWLIEHPPLYTAGTSAKPEELIEARFPVHATGRGGQFTYHGPGQRVAYVMLDLKRRGPDVRRFVATLEEWIIRTLGGVRRRRRAARGPHRRLGAAARQGRRPRGQDRRHRHPREALGDAARHRAQRRLRPFAFLRHRAVRRRRRRATASPASPISASARRMAEVDAALRREFEPLFGANRDAR